MKGLLSNALYSSYYTRKKPVELSQWEQFRHLLQRLFDDHDVIPLAGTTAGLMVGGSIIILFLSMWYLWLCRRRRRQSSGSEYVHLLSMVSRATSDDSQYNQHRRQQQQQRKKPNTNWWNLLLSKKSKGADNPIPKISGPVCYLLYESDNGGQLVQFYSAIALELESPTDEKTIVAIWKPSCHIPSHKFTHQGCRTVLTTNCTLGFQGKHNYCLGICKFLQVAFACGGGTITFLNDPPLATDVYLYLHDSRPQYQTMPLDVAKTYTLPSHSLAVACVPNNTIFHKNRLAEMHQWLQDGEREGSSIRF